MRSPRLRLEVPVADGVDVFEWSALGDFTINIDVHEHEHEHWRDELRLSHGPDEITITFKQRELRMEKLRLTGDDTWPYEVTEGDETEAAHRRPFTLSRSAGDRPRSNTTEGA